MPRPRMNPWQTFYWAQSRRSPYGTFGPKFLNQNLRAWGGPVDLLEKTATSTLASAALPAWAARADGAPPLGALLAILDQVSTFCGQAEFSPTGRSGLSVVLGGDVPPDAPRLGPGAPLLVETRPLKVGRTLGFLACDVLCGETERVVLRGHHSKFLSISPLWDVVLHSPLSRLSLPILTKYLDRFDDIAYEGAEASVDDVFDFRGDGDGLRLDVRKSHCNGLGSFHGGAACTTAELAAERLLGADRGAATSMHVTLMSSILAGRAARFAAPWASDKAAHVVISDGTGAPCYDVRLGYGG